MSVIAAPFGEKTQNFGSLLVVIDGGNVHGSFFVSTICESHEEQASCADADV